LWLWVGYEIVENARANLQAQRIASGFGFLSNTASFAVSQALIPYSESGHLCAGVHGRPPEHAAGFHRRYHHRHHYRRDCCARAAVAELAAGEASPPAMSN
jgi:hypothetical protein